MVTTYTLTPEALPKFSFCDYNFQVDTGGAAGILSFSVRTIYKLTKEVLPKPSSHPAGGAAEILTDLGKPSSHSAGGAAEILTDLGKS